MKALKLFASLIIVASIVTMTTFAQGLNVSDKAIMDKLKSKITVNGVTYVIPENYVAQAENYLNSSIDTTPEQSVKITAMIDSQISEFSKSPTTDIRNMSQSLKQSILLNAKKAGEVVGLKVAFANNLFVITDSTGTVVFNQAPIIKKTGTDAVIPATAFALITVLFLAGFYVTKQKVK
jgi:hypothetical protein